MAAFAALLRRGATTYALTIGDEFSPPSLDAEIAIIGGSGPSAPSLVRETMGTPTRMSVPLKFRQTTQALLQAEVDALDAYLRGGECTLEVSFTDAAAPTIWTVYHAQPVQPAFTRHANNAHEVLQYTLSLVVSPFVAAAAATLHDAKPISAPDSLSLAAMTGSYRSPLGIEVAAIGDATHSLYLAVDTEDFDAYLADAADLTWGTGATDTADADARSGTAVYVRSLTAVAAPLDTADYPEGPYLILARVKVRGGETGYITTDRTKTIISFTRSSWHIVELGTCYLPARRVRGGAAANLNVSVYGSSAASGKDACIDWVYPLPLGDGMLSYHPASATGSAATIGRDADSGVTYVDDVANEESVTGTTLMALSGRLLVVAEAVAGADPTHAVAVTVTHTPRFAWMR